MATEDPGGVPEGGWGWCVVLATFISTGLSAGNYYSFGVLFAALLDAFNGTKSETAWIGSILAFMFVTGSALSHVVVKKIGHRATVMLAGTIASVGLFVSSFTTSLYQLYFTYGCVTGIGLGFGFIPCVDQIGKYFKKRFSLAIGLGMAGTGGGQLMLSLLNQVMVDHYGWRGMLLVLSALTANLCVAGALLRPIEPYKPLETDNRTDLTHQQSNGTVLTEEEEGEATTQKGMTVVQNGVPIYDNHQNEETSEKKPKTRTFLGNQRNRCVSFCSTMFDKDLLTHPVFLLQALIGAGQVFGHGTVSAHAVRRLRDFGVPNTKSAIVSSVMGLAQLTGRPLYGAIANSGRVKPHVLYGISMATCSGATIFSIYVKSFAAQLFYIAMYGMCLGGYIILIPIVVNWFHGKEKIAHGMSFVIQIQGVVALMVSPLTGHMRDVYGDYDAAFWLVVIAYLFCMVAAFSLPVVDRLVEKRRKCNTYDATPESNPSEVFVLSELISTV